MAEAIFGEKILKFLSNFERGEFFSHKNQLIPNGKMLKMRKHIEIIRRLGYSDRMSLCFPFHSSSGGGEEASLRPFSGRKRREEETIYINIINNTHNNMQYGLMKFYCF